LAVQLTPASSVGLDPRKAVEDRALIRRPEQRMALAVHIDQGRAEAREKSDGNEGTVEIRTTGTIRGDDTSQAHLVRIARDEVGDTGQVDALQPESALDDGAGGAPTDKAPPRTSAEEQGDGGED
jgi:hypothetical protein